MIDFEQIQVDYATCYADKSRIKFIEKYLSTFNASVGRMTPFNLFPRQKVFLNSLANNKASIAIKHRQCGITTISSAWITAQCVFADADSPEVILCIANKLEQANEIVTKIRDFLLQVPRWYWGDDYFSLDPKSEKNTKDIFVKNSKSMLELFNGCKIYARASSANAARGISAVSILIFDEAAFIEEGLASYSSAVAATASQPNAKIIMVSTPNGKDQLYYNTYKQAIAKENNYNAVEFKWYQDLRYNKFLKWYRQDKETGSKEILEEEVLDASGTIKYDEDKWRELERKGYKPTNDWYEDMCRSFNNDTQKIAQELDVSFMGSANNVVDPKAIEDQSTFNVREPLENMKDPMTEDTWFWKPPIDGHRYICACLPEGEKVLTKRGLTCVEDVRDDDLLITKEGEFTEIKYNKRRYVTGEKTVKIQLYNILRSTNFTYNHPIWVSNVSKSKRVYKNRQYCGFTFNHKFDYQDAETVTKDSWMEVPNRYLTKDTAINTEMDIFNSLKELKKEVLNDRDFWWYCGIWLAEGHNNSKTNRIITTHNINEREIQNRIIDITKRLFNRNGNFYDVEKENKTNVYFQHKELAKFITETFGKYAYHKNISEWVKYIPNEFKVELFKGYFDGDGWDDNGCINITSASEKLLCDFQDILFSLGISSSVTNPQKKKEKNIKGRTTKSREVYNIRLGLESTKTFFKLLESGVYENNAVKKYTYFSDDLSKIYIRVKNTEVSEYTGYVYNYETVSTSHSFCANYIATHNCDPSRGISEDRTAIEIIDMDGRDKNGFPIIEQVMEYLGKKLGDDVGGMIYEYAKMYNNAYVVVDATGGSGDALLLTLINMGYKNLYYEDNNQKTYTLQNTSKDNLGSYRDRLPGFHFQGNRYAVLSNFAGMVRSLEFKIRSIRVINELETWIFKEGTGRMDHMSGSHDDTITCLAMALFVMKYSLNKLENVKSKDAAILGAYIMNGGYSRTSRPTSHVDMTPKNNLPFYNNKTLTKYPNGINGDMMWLFSTRK